MSSSGVANTITVAAPPTTPDVASQILATMAVLSGVITDYNPGSQARTIAESVGAVVEQQGIWAQAQAYQALIYAALSLFKIAPGVAVAATGTVTFSTSRTAPYPGASQNVPLPAGTIVQTNGGIQFQTTTPVILSAGVGSIDVPVQAVNAGAAGNVAQGTVLVVVSGINYPLFVNNAAAMSGGADAPSVADSLALFAAEVAAIGLSTPVAIANAAIGVTYSSEVVKYSTLYEPWIAAGSGAGSGVAGWQLYIDNGLGTASSGLIAAVDAVLRGGTTTGGASDASGAIGYRDAGVPYAIFAVTPTYALVGVSGTLIAGVSQSLVQDAIAQAVSGYFTLPFGASAQQAVISATVANAALGSLSALTVSLYASGSITPVSTLTTSPSGRILLAPGGLSISLVSGS